LTVTKAISMIYTILQYYTANIAYLMSALTNGANENKELYTVIRKIPKHVTSH